MTKMIVFHSGNPGWLSCSKAIGIARAMKEKFSDKVDLEIHTTDSEAARGYLFRSSTTVLLGDKQVPLETALSPIAMEHYLQDHL